MISSDSLLNESPSTAPEVAIYVLTVNTIVTTMMIETSDNTATPATMKTIRCLFDRNTSLRKVLDTGR